MGTLTKEYIRKNGKKINSKVLALGEKTGHSHTIEEDNGFERYELDGRRYLLTDTGLHVMHEEHGVGTIEPGIYEERIDREFDYSAQAIRDVVD